MRITNQATLGSSYGAGIGVLSDQAQAAPVLSETGGTLAVSDTEVEMYVRNAPESVFEPRVVLISLDDMVALDDLKVRVYYRISEAGGWLQHDYAAYVGIDGGLADGDKLIAVDLLPCRFGVRLTLQMTVGSADFPWSAVEEV